MARNAEPGTVAATARSAHISAWSGRPDITIQFASDVAARAPISASTAGSCACHAASKRSSALGDPRNTSSRPVKASRRALDGLARLQDACRRRGIRRVEERSPQRRAIDALAPPHSVTARLPARAPTLRRRHRRWQRSPRPMLRARRPTPHQDQVTRPPDEQVGRDRRLVRRPARAVRAGSSGSGRRRSRHGTTDGQR